MQKCGSGGKCLQIYFSVDFLNPCTVLIHFFLLLSGDFILQKLIIYLVLVKGKMVL